MLNQYVLFSTLLTLTLHINMKCNYNTPNKHDTNPIQQQLVCPVNSHCLPNSHCDCDVGYVAGCTQKATRMISREENHLEITNQTYTFMEVVANSEIYTLLSFNVCRLNTTEVSNFYIDVWDDNGTYSELNKQNAEFGGKIWPIMPNSCLILTTPFMFFSRKTNGQTQSFILGLKKLQSGSQYILGTVVIDQIDFWSLMSKLIFIIVFCFFITVTMAIVFIVYKRRRRQLFIQDQNQQKDIKHLDIFMPKIKLTPGENPHLVAQLCSICLIELGEQNQLRKTVCGHVFHLECIDSWCKSNLSCPVCRKSFDLNKLQEGMSSFEVDMTEISDGQRLRENIL